MLDYTICVRDITFSADESLIDRARQIARVEGKTMEEACREWLESYASRSAVEVLRHSKAEIEDLFLRLKHVKAGRKFTREEMNER